MKIILFCLIASLTIATAQDAEPDYKALYLKANAAAAAWKDRALQLEKEKQTAELALRDQKVINDILRKQSVALPTEAPAPVKKDTVADGIRSAAEQKWPGNYRMQKYEIETQTAAFQALKK